METSNCLCSCRGAHEDVGSIDLQVTHDVNIITAVRKENVRLVHDNRKLEVRYKGDRTLRVASRL